MSTRKQLLKVLGMAGVVAGTPLGKLLSPVLPAHAVGAPSNPAVGELYAGFLLLPKGALVPSTVQARKFGIPIVCGMGGGKTTAVSTHYDRHLDVRKAARLPLYTIPTVPPGLRPIGGDIIAYEWGSVFTASLSFESYNSQKGAWEGGVSVWVQTDYSQPFPFWFDPTSSGDGITGRPEKVDFLPAPGLQVASGMGLNNTRLGYVYHWIKDGLLYRFNAENCPSLSDAQTLAASLTLA